MPPAVPTLPTAQQSAELTQPTPSRLLGAVELVLGLVTDVHSSGPGEAARAVGVKERPEAITESRTVPTAAQRPPGRRR